MKTIKKRELIILIVLNSMVLMGQIYPAGAPPFARVINIIFLVVTLMLFIASLKNNNN